MIVTLQNKSTRSKKQKIPCLGYYAQLIFFFHNGGHFLSKTHENWPFTFLNRSQVGAKNEPYFYTKLTFYKELLDKLKRKLRFRTILSPLIPPH